MKRKLWKGLLPLEPKPSKPPLGKPRLLKQFDESQSAITSALGRLIAISENYPDLKANQNFLELQAQLEGTENRIAVARKDFNNAVKTFNTAVRRFPANILASLFGFEAKAYLQSQDNANQAPQISF